MIVGREPVQIAVVQVQCALCEDLVDVAVYAGVMDWSLQLDLGYENMWAHRFVHEERGELERRIE